MRTPLGIGLVVGLLILLTLAALLHLTLSPRKRGRWGWLLTVALVPVLGPLLYLAFGRRTDAEDWDDLAAIRAYTPPVAQPAEPEPAPYAEPDPIAPYRDDLDAPSLPRTAFPHEHAAIADVPVEELAYDNPAGDAAADALPDYTVRDEPPISDDLPDASAYEAIEEPSTPEPAAAVFLADLSHTSDAPEETSTDPGPPPDEAVAPVVVVPDAPPAEAPMPEAAPSAEPEASAVPVPHLRARRRKKRR